MNPLANSDSYKYSHAKQYPPGMTGLCAYIEARTPLDTVHFGVSPIIDYMTEQRVTMEHVHEMQQIAFHHGVAFDFEGFSRMVKVHGGHWPVIIRTPPEGLVIPGGNVLMQITSSDEHLAYMPMLLETQLVRMWYPAAVATQSHMCKKMIREYMLQSCDTLDKLPFMLHDFGARGVSSNQSAILGGMAHLTSFLGTDTMAAVAAARTFYKCKMAGHSINAMEHSTVTSWLREGEEDAYRNMLMMFGGPGKLIACVSDSYNFWHAVEHIWGERMRQAVVNSQTTVVIRPDSGDPLAGIMRVLPLLAEKFGVTHNSKAHRVLNNVRLIQGDGVAPDVIESILLWMHNNGWSADNIAFGMGSAMLQEHTRDDFGFAMKCSAVRIGPKWQGVSKSPVDMPSKRSKQGKLELLHSASGYETVDALSEEGQRKILEQKFEPVMETVYSSGMRFRNNTMESVRKKIGTW
jgi:nicotinamide phosphoribosyltransferase